MSPLGDTRAQCTQLSLSAPDWFSQPEAVQCFCRIIWVDVKERHHHTPTPSIDSPFVWLPKTQDGAQSVCSAFWNRNSQKRLRFSITIPVFFYDSFSSAVLFDLSLLCTHSISSTAGNRARVGMKLDKAVAFQSGEIHPQVESFNSEYCSASRETYLVPQ